MRARPSLARAPARGEVKLHHYRRLPLQPPLFLLRLKLLAERLQTLRQPFARSSGWPRLQVPKMRILRPMPPARLRKTALRAASLYHRTAGLRAELPPSSAALVDAPVKGKGMKKIDIIANYRNYTCGGREWKVVKERKNTQ